MAHYSGVSIVVFEQVNTEWDLLKSFQKPGSRKNLEKSHAWPFERLSRTHKFFNGDHWIVPELKQFITKMISSNLKIYITNTKQNFKIITFHKNICSFVYPSFFK